MDIQYLITRRLNDRIADSEDMAKQPMQLSRDLVKAIGASFARRTSRQTTRI